MKKLILILTVIVFSCQSSQESELGTLKDEVMSIHDEVMPKMGELRRVRKSLLIQADSLVGIDSIASSKLTYLRDEIDNANEGMMQWMRNFEPEFEGTNEEIKAYLEEQKIAVTKVKDDMNASLASGKEALGN